MTTNIYLSGDKLERLAFDKGLTIELEARRAVLVDGDVTYYAALPPVEQAS